MTEEIKNVEETRFRRFLRLSKENFYTLFSHHHKNTLDYYEHTIPISIKGKKIRLCARCTGLTIGSIMMILLDLFLINNTLNPIYNLILCILLPIPQIVDWTTHKFTNRKVRSLWFDNSIRFFGGVLLGIGFWFVGYTGIYFFIPLIIFIAVTTYVFVVKIFHLKNKKIHLVK